MKRFGLLISLILSINLQSQTLLLEENFNYTVGDLSGQGSWNILGTDKANNLNVISGNLSYTNYPSGAVFNSVQAISGSSRDECVRDFHTSNITSGSLYLSLLVKVNSCGTDGNNDGYFLCLMSESGTTNSCRISVVDAGSGNIQFGIQRNAGTGGVRTLTTSSYSNSGTPTFLLVMKYNFTDGTVSLFVNPSLSGTEPSTADASNSTGNTISNLRRVQIRQGGGASDCDVQIDGIRVADSWSQAPLPVELSSFSAVIVNEGIKLNWRTETEVSNYGFEVERQAPLNPPKGGTSGEWEMIGFVEGHGNSNSPKEYSFIDKKVTGGKYAYRLKQVDNDGKFEYSKVIEINVGIPIEYELSQNYPNPFNPSTTIKFSIPEKGNVKLMVYNILGEEIATLLNEVKEAGVHTINYSAPDMTSGIYFYKIEVHNFVTVKKMQLVK